MTPAPPGRRRGAQRFAATPGEAVRIQQEMRGMVEAAVALELDRVRLVAGADVSYRRGDERLYAAAALFGYPGMEPVETAWVSGTLSFPYVPGLLAFREAPAVLEALDGLRLKPDVLLVDGHGVAHPRGIGIASHLGIVANVPSVGVAKTVLVGEYREPGPARGDSSPLEHGGETVGLALRTRTGVKPVFVSVGHLADLESAAALALGCCGRYRLPEPIREAHRVANLHRRAWPGG